MFTFRREKAVKNPSTATKLTGTRASEIGECEKVQNKGNARPASGHFCQFEKGGKSCDHKIQKHI